MTDKTTFLHRFSLFNLITIGIIAALGVAMKPIITPLVHIITGPLFIPGGAIAGGFYMFWIVLGVGLVKKAGTGTLIGLVQGILVIAMGIMGTHGIMSLITYTLPGVVVDLIFLLSKNKKYHLMHYVLGCMTANVVGTLMTNLLFFRLPYMTVVFILSSAALSGSIGGLMAASINRTLIKMNII